MVSRSFLVHLRYSFFSFHHHFFTVSASNIPKVGFLVGFLFSEHLIFFYFIVPFLPSYVVSRFSSLVWRILRCHISSLCLDCTYWLLVLEFQMLFHFLQSIWCRPCTLDDWYFIAILLGMYPPVHFLTMWSSGIITFTNNNGDSASPWNMPHWVFGLLSFFLQLLILLSRFPWCFR